MNDAYQHLRPWAEAFLEARRGTAKPGPFLELSAQFPNLLADLRTFVAYAVARKLFLGNAEILAAYGPQLAPGVNPDDLLARVDATLRSMDSPKAPLACCAVFDLLAEVRAVVVGDAPLKPFPRRGRLGAAEIAPYYAAAKLCDPGREALAHHVRRSDGRPTSLGRKLPPWLTKSLEEVLGPAAVQTPRTGIRTCVASAVADLGRSVREMQPAFIYFLLALGFTAVVFGFGAAASRATVATEPVQPVVQNDDRLLTKFTKAIASMNGLRAKTLLIAPRTRDDLDKVIAEAILKAVPDLIVVAPNSARRMLGPDVPAYDGKWLSPEDVAWACGKDGLGGLLYLDVERLSPNHARLAIHRLDVPTVELFVTGTIDVGSRPEPVADHYITRAREAFMIDPRGVDVKLNLRQAFAAARGYDEAGRVHLTAGIFSLSQGEDAEARKAFAKAWPLLGETDREAIPEPLRLDIAAQFVSPEERVRKRVTILPQATAVAGPAAPAQKP